MSAVTESTALPLALKGVLPLVALRLAILAVGWAAVMTLGIYGGRQGFDGSNSAVMLPARWDAGWYVSIAMSGYRWDPASTEQQPVVFFPALPGLIALGPAGFVARLWTGTAIAIAFFGIACAYLFRLARAYLTEEQARACTWLVAAYPFAIYFGVPYTESLFLAGSVAAFYHFREQQFARAFAWGLFTGLVRPNGFLLAACLALAVLTLDGRIAWPRGRGARWWLHATAAVAAPVLGVLAYTAYLQYEFGDPLAWMKGQAAWERSLDDLPEFARVSALTVWNEGAWSYLGKAPLDTLNLLAAAVALLIAVPVTRRFGPALGAFVVFNIAPPLLFGGPMSLGRMTSVLFPVFLWLAAVIPAAHRPAWIAAFAAAQGLAAALFFTWRPLV